MPRSLLVGSDRQHQRDHRAAAGGDDDAGEQQARLRPAAVAVRQPEDNSIAASAPTKASAIDAGSAEAEHDGQHRADTGPAGNAQHVRIGQRIAQQHLQQRAGQRQQAAAGKTGSARGRRRLRTTSPTSAAAPNSAARTSPAE
jgi:hypothetical protein